VAVVNALRAEYVQAVVDSVPAVHDSRRSPKITCEWNVGEAILGLEAHREVSGVLLISPLDANLRLR